MELPERDPLGLDPEGAGIQEDPFGIRFEDDYGIFEEVPEMLLDLEPPRVVPSGVSYF